MERNNQTDDELSEVSNGNDAVANKSIQTDEDQSVLTNGHEAGANKQISQFTVIEKQRDLLDFPFSKAQ